MARTKATFRERISAGKRNVSPEKRLGEESLYWIVDTTESDAPEDVDEDGEREPPAAAGSSTIAKGKKAGSGMAVVEPLKPVAVRAPTNCPRPSSISSREPWIPMPARSMKRSPRRRMTFRPRRPASCAARSIRTGRRRKSEERHRDSPVVYGSPAGQNWMRRKRASFSAEFPDG